MPAFLSAFTRPDPCCAQITPTRSKDARAALGRLLERARDAIRACARQLRGPDQLPDLDAATLRDLGLSHIAATWAPRQMHSDPWL